MNCKLVMSRFEVMIDDELIKDIGSPGKVIRQELSNVVNLQTGQYEDHGQMLSVNLEKDDGVIKLLITGKTQDLSFCWCVFVKRFSATKNHRP